MGRAARPEATTTAGAVRGQWHGSTAVFLGVPFAQAPVGSLRFEAPAPRQPWAGVREAVTFGSTPQRMKFTADPTVPEPSITGDSTLNVNVFSPDLDGRAPVLFYVHGGSFVSGSPAGTWYDGRTFARHGVVTVTASYRLGFDGFGWIEDAPPNRGVLDWVAALAWVRENIRAFGGDPDRVTIGGQSAGAGAILTLLALPEARQYFAQAIAMSGLMADIPAERAERLGRRIARLGGVEPTKAGLAEVPEEEILRLQVKATRLSFVRPFRTARAAIYETLKFGPVIDGSLLTRPVLDSLRAGAGAEKPMLLGATDHEVSSTIKSFDHLLRHLPLRTVLGTLGLSRSDEARYLAANPGLAAQGTSAVLAQYVTDTIFRSLALDIAESRQRVLSNDAARTWLYRFSLPYSVNRDAPHCADLPFFFDRLGAQSVRELAGVNPPQSLATTMHAEAASFISGGNPGWTRFERKGRQVRIYDVPATTQADGYASTRPLIGVTIGR